MLTIQLVFVLGACASVLQTCPMRRVPRVLLTDDNPTPEPKPNPREWLSVIHHNGKHCRVDGRSREGRLLRDTRDVLLEQLNRKPTTAEVLLINRLAWAHLCVQLLDSRL